MFYFNNQKSNCDLGKTTIENKYDSLCADLLADNVTDMVFPKKMEKIETYLFQNNTKLKSVSFEEGSKMKSIGESLFYSCINLSDVQLPPSLKSIGNWCFWDCQSLTELTIPNSVTSIGNGCFMGCYNLETININKPKDSIPGYPWGCQSINVKWSDGETQGTPYQTPLLTKYYGNEKILPPYYYGYIGTYLNEDELPCVYWCLLFDTNYYTPYDNCVEYFIHHNFELFDEFQLKFHISDITNNGYQYLKIFGDDSVFEQGSDTSLLFMFNIGYDGTRKLCQLVGGSTAEEGGYGYIFADFEQDKINFGWNTLSMKFDQEQNLWALYLNDSDYSEPLYVEQLPAQCFVADAWKFINNHGDGQNCVDIVNSGYKKNGNWVYQFHQ